MKKFYAVLLAIILVSPLAAQQRTGNIYGIVIDQENNPLPGVTVTLTHRTVSPMTAVTSAEGRFRFLSLFPAGDYVIKTELAGFKPLTQTDIIVSVGVNSEIKMIMEIGKLEESITVTAVTPVVDSKKTTVTQTMNFSTLQNLPSARDPWAILQMAPSVLTDRENVGGNESGQQSIYVSKGGDQYTSQWTLDGVLISDPAARGGSPTYYDFDVFEEMQITTGGMDVDTQLGGVALNLVTRRGGNRVSLGGRFYLADQNFQAKITPEKIASLGVPGYNRIVDTKDFGFNTGGPLIKDKIWWWGSYGIQDLKTIPMGGKADNSYLTTMAAKLNFQLIPQNRAEIFVHANKKEKWGRGSTTQFPDGWYQHGKYRFGSPIIKIQDEHMFGNSLFLSAKYGFTDAGFGNWPMNDQDLKEVRWYNVEQDLFQRSQTWYFVGRPNKDISLSGTYFNDSFLGLSHEIKFGAEFTDRRQDYVSGFPGNFRVNYNYNTPTVDWNGDGKRDIIKSIPNGFDIKLARFFLGGEGSSGTKTTAFYLRDTVTTGRFNILLGLRFDRQHPWQGKAIGDSLYTSPTSGNWRDNYYGITQKYLTQETAEKIQALMPSKSAPDVDPDFNWDMWSPRVGITWDVAGDGKTMVKLNGATYGEYMGILGGFWSYGGLGGTIDFWWNDVNRDERMDWRELYWASYTSARTPYRAFDDNGNFVGNYAREFGYMYAGFNFQDPGAIQPSYWVVDPDWKSNRTWELLLTLERELFPDFGVALDLSYRKYDRLHNSFRYYPATDHIRSKDDWMVAGTVPATLTDPATGQVWSTEGAAGRSWYVLKEGIGSTDYQYRTNWPNERNNVFYGADLRFTKRLTNKWMLNGSLSLGWQAAHFGNNGYEDPTNVWAFEGEPYAYDIGGSSGRINQPAYTFWMTKLQGLYQLPWDMDISFTAHARQGWVIPVTFTLTDYRLPNPLDQDAQIQLDKFSNRKRLPLFWDCTFKIQKMIKVAGMGRMYFMADVFNPFNLDTISAKRAIDYGNFYLQSGTHSVTARSGEPYEVINPRIFRFGIRFEF